MNKFIGLFYTRATIYTEADITPLTVVLIIAAFFGVLHLFGVK